MQRKREGENSDQLFSEGVLSAWFSAPKKKVS